MSGLSIDMIIHPGEILKEVLRERNIMQLELSQRTGVSPKHINTILNGSKPISVTFAKRLEYALNIPSSFWRNLQSSYDAEMSEFNELNSISDSEKQIIKKLSEVIDFIKSKNLIEIFGQPEQTLLELRKFLNVSNLTFIPSIVLNASFRLQDKINVDPYALFAWQKICNVLTDGIPIESIDENYDVVNGVKSLIPQIKKLMFLPQAEFENKLTSLFATIGIAFGVVPAFKHAPVQGLIKKTKSGEIIMCLTFRQKRADIFWFSLFHEIGHLVNGDVKQKFVDIEISESDKEKKADLFAQNALIENLSYTVFVKNKDFSLSSIKNFSLKQGIPPMIVIGRLQNDGLLNWHEYQSELKMYSP